MAFACRTILIGCACLFGASQPFAADLPVKAIPPESPTPVLPWNSCYVGGNAGAMEGADRLTLYPTGSLLTIVSDADRAVNTHSYSPHSLGATIGAGVGCNWRRGAWVIGGETDFDWSGLRENSFKRYDFIAFATAPTARWDAHNETVWKSVEWFSTVRGRFGYDWKSVLVYLTAGLAIARVSGKFSYLDTVLGFEFAGTQSRTRVGPTAGGGVEWRIAPRWTMKVEYLYVDLGSFAFDASPNSPGATFRWGMNVTAREHVARLGLNFGL